MRRTRPSHTPPSDDTLIRAHQRGDSAAWNALAERYLRLAYATPHALGCSAERSSAIAREALGVVAGRLSGLEVDADLPALVVEAARAATPDSAPDLPTAATPSAFAPLGARLQAQHRVWQAVQQLPSECATLLSALHYGPLADAPDEVARTYGLSRQDMATHEAACLRRLLDALQSTGPLWTPTDTTRADEPAPADCQVPFADLVAYASGELHGPGLESLAAHLAGTGDQSEPCQSCRANLAKLERVLGLMHTDQTPELPTELLDSVQAMAEEAAAQPLGRITALPEADEGRGRTRVRVLSIALPIVCLLALAAGYAYWPRRQTGRLVEYERGDLNVKLGPGAPWLTGQVGQVLAEGASLESETPATALVRFWDGSLLRVQSEGSWRLERLRGSRNDRLVRLTLRQSSGSASYASTPPRNLASLRMRIELPKAYLDLAGTATVTVPAEGGLHVQIHQGSARLRSGAAFVDLVAGQEIYIQPDGTLLLL